MPVTHEFNTAISRMMEFVNAGMKAPRIDNAVLEPFVLLLAPFAPHMAEELWERLGHSPSLAYEPWPEHDETLLTQEFVEIPVQVNGKVRSRISAAPGADKATVLSAAKSDETIQGYLDGKQVVKEVYVPGRMVNFVIK